MSADKKGRIWCTPAVLVSQYVSRFCLRLNTWHDERVIARVFVEFFRHFANQFSVLHSCVHLRRDNSLTTYMGENVTTLKSWKTWETLLMRRRRNKENNGQRPHPSPHPKMKWRTWSFPKERDLCRFCSSRSSRRRPPEVTHVHWPLERTVEKTLRDRRWERMISMAR